MDNGSAGVMNSEVELAVSHLDSDIMAELCTSSLKHILYIREQIPVPFEIISQNPELSGHRPSRRKIEEFLNYFSEIEDNIRIICSMIGIII